ncbi:MAG: HDIG domain-containing protein, partial [Sphingobacteriales bacterium]
MQNPLQRLNKTDNDYVRYALLLASILLITFIIPKQAKFKYEFEQGKPWMHEDLVAPFSFAIQKNPTQVQREREQIRTNFKPFYKQNTKIEADRKRHFTSLINQLSASETDVSAEEKKYLLQRGTALLDEIYERGIIALDTNIRNRPKEYIITELRNNVAEDKQLQAYFTTSEARSAIITRANEDSTINKAWFIRTIIASLEPNIFYEQDLSEKKLNELLENVSPTRGMVRQNEKIITKGSIITTDRMQVLTSLKNDYEAKHGKSYLLFIGYLVLVASLFIMYAIHLEIFHHDILSSTRSMVLILINVLIFILLTAYIAKRQSVNVYLIPYTIIPIVLLAFFGLRIAFVTYFLVILLCGLVVPNPYEFVLVQTMAGFTAMLSMARIRYISQFFISALLIFMTYCLVYLGFSFIKSGLIRTVEWDIFIWFGGNFILTLLAYPLIYANEKIFGFLSDISLLELSDINNKLLKELFLRAPGTFQHSLQVANLAEAVIDRIGGNALLTRVGALYHDVGKLHNPEFFIENQKHSFNPHDNLTDLQSADMIIGHVTKGVETAQEYNLPKRVIEFIRTHHGTTRVEYFYKHYVQEHIDEDVDDTAFRYPGPKPSSKETAVVMIVDSVEAASRSLKEPDEKQIDNVVDKIIDSKIQDNQFDYATITINEINATRRILKKLVKSIYHIRIQYPAEAEKKKSTNKKTWVFKADNVRDFAWTSSRKFVWDAMPITVEGKKIMCMSFYGKEAYGVYRPFSTKAVAHTIKSYSKFTIPYPYPVAQSVEAANGMEYPMICFNY